MSAVCANKGYEKIRRDYSYIKSVLDLYRSGGGFVPVGLSNALFVLEQAFVSGDNVDAALKSACLEMEGFLAANEEYCARYHSKTDPNSLYYACMASREVRRYQIEAVRKVLNIGDPKSFVSVFTKGSREQIREILREWLGDAFVETFMKKNRPSGTGNILSIGGKG